jgi:hypothetical protein
MPLLLRRFWQCAVGEAQAAQPPTTSATIKYTQESATVSDGEGCAHLGQYPL